MLNSHSLVFHLKRSLFQVVWMQVINTFKVIKQHFCTADIKYDFKSTFIDADEGWRKTDHKWIK